jgi:hypothetical protein
MGKLLFVMLVALLAAATYGTFGSTASARGFSPAYHALRDNLIEGQRPHIEWVAYLERNPRAQVPVDVVSLRWQREAVEIYNRRLLAISLLANGVTHWQNGASIYETTFNDFTWMRSQHLILAARDTYSGVAMQHFFANQYTWRVAMLQLIASENWPASPGSLW